MRSAEADPQSNVEATRTNRPTYAGAFRCIGPQCEDHCCGDWDIPVDKVTYEKYQLFPVERLGSIVSNFVFPNAAGSPESLYAHIYRRPSGLCPFLGSDHLCDIHKEYGPQLLTATCSVFPRSLSSVDGQLEGSLSLSCPEAARNILLNPDFMKIEADLLSGEFRTDNVYQLVPSGSGPVHKPYRSFYAIRALLIDIVQDRSQPLWHRLLVIGFLCQRLQEITTAEGEEAVPAFLEEYREMLNHSELLEELQSMPSDPKLKLEIIIALTRLFLKIIYSIISSRIFFPSAGRGARNQILRTYSMSTF